MTRTWLRQIADPAQDQGGKRAQRNVEKDAGLSCAFITCCREAQIEMKKGRQQREHPIQFPISARRQPRDPPSPLDRLCRSMPRLLCVIHLALPSNRNCVASSVSGHRGCSVFRIAGLCNFNSAQGSACSCSVRHSAPQLSAPHASTPTPAHGRAPSQAASHADWPGLLARPSAHLDPLACLFTIFYYDIETRAATLDRHGSGGKTKERMTRKQNWMEVNIRVDADTAWAVVSTWPNCVRSKQRRRCD
ncbi:hypothetical protein L1887_59220 [Cichorium endivia]|nr:hypothetical protein L1887_59220 [Cichorium endivia]